MKLKIEMYNYGAAERYNPNNHTVMVDTYEAAQAVIESFVVGCGRPAHIERKSIEGVIAHVRDHQTRAGCSAGHHGFAYDVIYCADESDVQTEQYRMAAKELWHKDGEIEVDADAVVSIAEEDPKDGAYVAAWVWVNAEELQQVGDQEVANG